MNLGEVAVVHVFILGLAQGGLAKLPWRRGKSLVTNAQDADGFSARPNVVRIFIHPIALPSVDETSLLLRNECWRLQRFYVVQTLLLGVGMDEEPSPQDAILLTLTNSDIVLFFDENCRVLRAKCASEELAVIGSVEMRKIVDSERPTEEWIFS